MSVSAKKGFGCTSRRLQSWNYDEVGLYDIWNLRYPKAAGWQTFMVGVEVFQPMYNGVLHIYRSASSPSAPADGCHSLFFRSEHRPQLEYPFRCIETANVINMWSRTCEHL